MDLVADSAEDPQVTAAAGGAAGVPAASGIGLGAGRGAVAAQQLRLEGETLTTFKNRVDELLTRLEKSQAAPRRLADGTMPAGRLGSFDEADALHGAYTRVHARLEHLSRMLALQIEGLMVTVDASKSNYHNLDDDIRDRLHRIRVESDKLAADEARLEGQRGAGGKADGPGQGGHGSASDEEAGGL